MSDQNAIVSLIVLLALGYLLRVAHSTLLGRAAKSPCHGSCDGCQEPESTTTIDVKPGRISLPQV